MTGVRASKPQRSPAASWTKYNPVLIDGLFGFETDTHRFKIGDGATPWSSLGYYDDSGTFVPYGPGTSAKLSISNLGGALPTLNLDGDNSAQPILRMAQTGTGPIAKWKSAGVDVGFIMNGGGLYLAPKSETYAMHVIAPSWTQAKSYDFGNKDGLFFIRDFVDSSGTGLPGTVQYSKLFGGNATKSGNGNLDAFWASVVHHGTGEVGLIIADVTGDAGGNLWGMHMALQANTVEANQFGARIELTNNVAHTTTVGVGAFIRSVGSQPSSVAIQIDGSGGWTDYFNAYDSAGTLKLNVRGSDGVIRNMGVQPISDAGANVGSNGYRYNNGYFYKLDIKPGTLPASGLSAGMIAFDNSQAKLNVYNGTAWEKVLSRATETTGSGSALMGSNSPATINTAPYTWMQVKAADGTTVYIPAWK